jgi:hypothetical protein
VTIPQSPEMGSKAVAELQNLRDWGPHTVEYVVNVVTSRRLTTVSIADRGILSMALGDG